MRYLDLIRARIDDVRRDVPRLIELGEAMAPPHLRGGSLFTPQIGTYWPTEFGYRAGGLMGLKPPTYLAQSADDVAFTTLPDPRRRHLREDERWRRLIDSPAQIFVNGRPEDLAGACPLQRVAGFNPINPPARPPNSLGQ